MNIALTGFMGAGKSTAGRRLARLLGLPFVDVDYEIERERGSISSIFEREGEAAFRRYESEAISRIADGGPHVIAVGGGAVVDEANRVALRRRGLIVNLTLKPETAFRRVAHRTHRPMLGATPTLETIAQILRDRAHAYADNDLSIAVDSKTPLAVAHIIARWYKRRASRAGAIS